MKNVGAVPSSFTLVHKALAFKVAVLFMALYYLANAGLFAGEMTDARINIGLKLFRAILAADLDIKSKKSTHGKLPVLIIYKDNSNKGKRFADNLLMLGRKSGQAQIKNIPIDVKYISYQTFLVEQHSLPAGIFLVEKMSIDELQPIVDYGIKNHIITYSPFDGDVEKNITAGVTIGARVRPTINMNTLNESDIQIKSFFLKVAKKYEP